MRIPRLLIGAVVVLVAVTVTTTAPAEAGAQYRRLADVNLETYVTRTAGGSLLHMEPSTPGESQEWVVSRGYSSLITMVVTYPSGRCWSVDEENGGEGAPLRLVDCVAGRRAQQWKTTAFVDGVMFRNLHVDHNTRCAGFLPDEPVPVLRELTCDENDPTQRFSFQPYLD